MGSASSKHRGTNRITWIPVTVLLLLAITASAAPVTNTSNASSLAHHATLTSRGWLRRPHRITPVIPSRQDETTSTGLNLNSHPNNLETFPKMTADESSSPSIHPWLTITPTQPSASSNSARNSLDKRGKKSSKLCTFDGRPIEYFNQSLPYTPAKDRGLQRDRKLDDLWNQTLNIKNLDGENIGFGPEKDRIFQLWDIKIEAPFKDHVNDTPDTRKRVDFITWLFEIPEETLGWFVNSNRWLSRPGAVEDREYLEPIDHYNWIAKAHSFLRNLTAAEQMEINTRIDNIDKLNTADLYKLYDTFEIRENMILGHKIQAAEFLQVQELTFPAANDSSSGLISTRKPIVLKDWKKDDDSRIHQFQDAGARYWVPASDSNHTDWASLTRAMIAHKTITEQRMIRHQAREFPKNFMNVPERRSFYENIGINPDGKDSDDIKKEAAYMLCVEELAFPEKPKSKKGKAVPVTPGDIPVAQMTDICDAQQQQERLKNLFFIERWDADRVDAQTSSQDKTSLFEVSPAGNEVEDTITAPFDDFDEEFDTLNNEAATSSTQAKRGLPDEVRCVENEIGDSIRTPYDEAAEALRALKNATTPSLNQAKRCVMGEVPHMQIKNEDGTISPAKVCLWPGPRKSPGYEWQNHPAQTNEAHDVPDKAHRVETKAPHEIKLPGLWKLIDEGYEQIRPNPTQTKQARDLDLESYEIRAAHRKHDPGEDHGPCGEKSPEKWKPGLCDKADKKQNKQPHLSLARAQKTAQAQKNKARGLPFKFPSNEFSPVKEIIKAGPGGRDRSGSLCDERWPEAWKSSLCGSMYKKQKQPELAKKKQERDLPLESPYIEDPCDSRFWSHPGKFVCDYWRAVHSQPHPGDKADTRPRR